MSISIIVADDQALIRDHICKFVSEIDDEFEVVASFEDGSDVIEFLKYNKADIILTDVLMCGVSGIDVAKFVYEQKINTHVVIISAYRDFEYARSALSYGVKQYLLKPTSTKELRKVLESIKSEIVKNPTEQNMISEISKIISVLDFDVSDDVVDRVIGEIMSYGGSLDKFRADVMQVFQLFDTRLTALGLDTSLVRKIKSEYINAAWHFSDDALKEWVSGNIRTLFSFVSNSKTDKNTEIIKRATDYINNHYSENISITDVADFVYLNEDYFGKLFRKKLDKSFSDYLTEVRMKEAERLLRMDKFKIYQIGEKVGYKSSNYFIKAFKTYTGFTPKEYLRNFGVENEQ